jgi:antitoxin (DNA-binding transcriptional repressor) of toxin-antitoxin stability system
MKGKAIDGEWSRAALEWYGIHEPVGGSIMATVTIEEAQAKLPDLIHRMFPGEELVITENQLPVAKLVTGPAKTTQLSRPGPGLLKGMITYMATDFNEPMDDLKEHME